MTPPDPTPPPRRPISPLWAVIALLFCAPLVFHYLKQVRMVNDVETWLPAHDAGAVVLQWSRLHFEPENRFLVSWDSSSLSDARVQALADRLTAAAPPNAAEPSPFADITRVVTPYEALSGMVRQKIDHATAIDRLSGVLVGIGPLKVRLTDAGRRDVESVQRQFLDHAASKLSLSAAILPAIPGAQGAEAARKDAVPAADAAAPEDDSDEGFRPTDWSPPAHDFQVRWPGMHRDAEESRALIEFGQSLKSGEEPLVDACFFAAGAPVAISVSLDELEDHRLRHVVDAVRQAAVEVGIPDHELRLGGSPIGRIQLNESSGQSVWNPAYPWWQFHKRSPFGLSALVGTVLAFILLKSVRLALLVLFTSGYTALATTALVPATGQTLNSVLMVMPNLLMVVTMSSLVHLANYWRHAACAAKRDPVTYAVGMSLEPTLLAGVTTSIGLASLVTSVLLPVRQFGLFSAAGCVLSMVMVLWAFPALLRIWPGRAAPLAAPHENAWHWFGLWVARRHRAIALVFLGLYGVAAYGLTYFHTETKVIRYFPESARIVQDYEFLEDNLAGIVGVDVILRFPPEKSRAQADDEESADEADSPAVARPATVTLDLFQRMELVRRLQSRLQSLPGVSGTMSLADFRQNIEARPGPGQPGMREYLRSLQIGKKKIFETHRDDTREFVTHAQTELSVVVDDVPRRIEIGEEVWRIRAQCSALTRRPYGEFLASIETALNEELRGAPGVEQLVTGTVPLFLRTQEALLDSLINSFGLAFATIAAVMMYQLRSVAAGALVMLPNILPIALVFGLISWYGIPLDVGTMVTASIAMGISVDSELHFVTWFKQSLQQGMSRDEAVAHGLVHCGPAMWQSCLVIALALQMLMFADLLMISRFGWLMAAMIIAAMFADLFYMPALLAGLMGRLIVKQMERETSSAARVGAKSPQEAVTQ